MEEKKRMQISKLLSLVLRHKPEAIGIQLDGNGWVAVEELLQGLRRHDMLLTREELQEVVTTNEKQRFAFNPDQTCIRASQGHSIAVDLGYTRSAPPEILFHGTGEHTIPLICRQGLLKRSRQHVHLSAEYDTAVKVGQRHGKPAVINVLAGEMHRHGYTFYRSANGVWLVDYVPVNYLICPMDRSQ
jgi:putative RNA 2'-phosphotransferase